jgi:predicted DNA-binding protein (MmcQ/YjbR family)
MTYLQVREYLLSRPHATSDFPFDDEAEVFRVEGKIFALMGTSAVPPRVNLKCQPELAADLRQNMPQVIPGYHMNKRHWNTVYFEGDDKNPPLPDDKVQWLIDHSWEQVVAGLTKTQRKKLGLGE